jgi:hypothetical protein
MNEVQLGLFVLALSVTVGAFGAITWSSLKRPEGPKQDPDSSDQNLR